MRLPRVLLLLLVSDAGCCAWAVEQTGEALRAHPPPAKPVDALLVPGCPTRNDGTVSTCIKRRVAVAVQAYRRQLAPRIVFSGGAVRNRHGEALAMAAYARSLGVPAGAILIETRARHTQQNVRYTARLLRLRGWTRVLLVTDPAQLPLALYLARLIGLRAYAEPTVPPLSSAELRARCARDSVEPLGTMAWY